MINKDKFEKVSDEIIDVIYKNELTIDEVEALIGNLMDKIKQITYVQKIKD